MTAAATAAPSAPAPRVGAPLDRSDQLVAALVVVAVWFHLFRVDSAPPGFWVDEAAIAGQAICVAQSGHELFGARWPVFAPLIGDGIVTPVTLYVSAAWTSVFGPSITAFRTLANVAGMVGAAGVAYGGRDTRERLWLAALTLTSPWLFPLSRMYMDPVFGFACLGWMFGFYRRERWLRFGIVSALAAMSYPPLRVHVALTWLLLALIDRGDRGVWRWVLGWASATVVAVVTALPMLRAFAEPAYRARGDSLAIWSEGFMTERGLIHLPTAERVIGLLHIYADNLRLFLSPSFLLWNGDANMRHGIGVGVLAWVEVAALLWLVGARILRQPTPVARETVRGLLLFLASISGAALTWEGQPHALRSIGASAALAWLVASVVTRAGPRMRAGFTALLVVGAVVFGARYLIRAPENYKWFQENQTEAIQGRVPDPQASARPARDYYELAAGRARCRADDPP